MIFNILITVFLLFMIAATWLNQSFSLFLKLLLSPIFLVGLYLANNPQKLDELANRIGVDAGSDLIFYLSTMLVIYAVLVIYHKIKLINKRIEELDRYIALSEAKKPDDGR